MTGSVSLYEGAQARQLLNDTEFIAAWRRLHGLSQGATAFQSPLFAVPWYQLYENEYSPWLLTQRGTDGELNGLLALAHDKHAGSLIVVGGHQAEYQGWLAQANCSTIFLAEAWRAIRARLPAVTLNFKYLPPALPRDAWLSAKLRGLIEPLARRRPLMRLDPERIEESLRKKGNKSKLNRLARLGEVRLERLRSAQALEPYFDQIIAHYDMRQGAAHDSCPFLTDTHKRALHLAWAEQPELLHVTILSVGNRLAAAHIGAISGDTVHLGIIAHAPLYAEHSVGKLQLLLLARHLAQEGFKTFDLTPGDDPWKERFADEHDEVYELRMFASALARLRATVPRRVATVAKGGARVFGITPDRWRRWRERGRTWIAGGSSTPDTNECWQRERNVMLAKPAGALALDAVGDLLFVPTPRTRKQFLTNALTRLERKEHVYTEVHGGRLRYCAWSRRTEDPTHGSAVLLYDIQSFDDEAVDTLFEQNVALIKTPVFVQVPAGAAKLGGVLRRLGFELTTSGCAPVPAISGAEQEGRDS
jgi:CelD/BcsL family acetyltransferase involved in cellulose biosynthesis